ncbi:DUF6098 family protein [Streptomyces sp. B1I3]|uniref:DUF6098 family protein n=1 Tax=Streptomyces sp. B1I3 TaxID=3042264 RepID=UPI00277F6187|nr:DUF6098 family protein [Streptomyces sp. B1I3]MDQ0793191.1 hypothetical protein [Streptomyces sp. B1I3]
MGRNEEMPLLDSLDAVADLVRRRSGLYVRWSRGPHPDTDTLSSRDELTGVPLPGLSANALDVEEWWGDRPVRTWVARRLYDYSHLPRLKGTFTRPWILHGTEAGRGPDNEPLVRDVEPLGWIAASVIDEADHEVTSLPGPWGPMRRDGDRPG